MAAPAAPGPARVGPGPAPRLGPAAPGHRQRLARDARAAGPPFPPDDLLFGGSAGPGSLARAAWHCKQRQAGWLLLLGSLDGTRQARVRSVRLLLTARSHRQNPCGTTVRNVKYSGSTREGRASAVAASAYGNTRERRSASPSASEPACKCSTGSFRTASRSRCTAAQTNLLSAKRDPIQVAPMQRPSCLHFGLDTVAQRHSTQPRSSLKGGGHERGRQLRGGRPSEADIVIH